MLATLYQENRVNVPLARRAVRGADHAQGDLREFVDKAAAGGIATQIHAIGDAAVEPRWMP